MKGFKPSVDLDEELDLYDRQMIGDKELNEAIDQAIEEYRKRK
jgi:hypothetical protein